MKLTNQAIEFLKEKIRVRTLLALAFDKHVDSIERWIRDNDSNGALTTATALQIIREESGLMDSEILTNEVAA